MRLARKLIAALVAGMCVVLAAYAAIEIERETSHFESHLRRDMILLGSALGATVHALGPDEARRSVLPAVSKASDEARQANARWVSLAAAPGDPDAPSASADELLPLLRGESVFLPRPSEEPGRLYTYVPLVPLAGAGPSALELSESLAEQHTHVRRGVRDTVVAVIAVALVAGLLATVVGRLFVGRPLKAIIEQARRIGSGDLSARLSFRQNDEVAELAEEMNAMSGRLMDAGERLRAETATRIATMEQLRHADRLNTVGKLAAGIAHELGTPLNVVSGRAQMIAAGGLGAGEISSCARIIDEQSKRMTGIIRQLLDFARPQPVSKSRVDLGELTAQTLELLAPLADKHEVAIELYRGKRTALACVDASQIQQALTNLVVNGIQAMSKGGVLRVEVGRGRVKPPADQGGLEADYVCLTVVDQGPGMLPKVREHVFEPFFTTKDVGEGTGLGLPVSYGIVREHDGWIAVESEPGRGSRFTIHLPEESG